MIRGTTPLLTFTLPVAVSGVTAAWATLSQPYSGTSITRSLSDMTASGYTLSFSLTQSETLSLNPSEKVKIQLRVKDNSNKAYASKTFSYAVMDILKEGAL